MQWKIGNLIQVFISTLTTFQSESNYKSNSQQKFMKNKKMQKKVCLTASRDAERLAIQREGPRSRIAAEPSHGVRCWRKFGIKADSAADLLELMKKRKANNESIRSQTIDVITDKRGDMLLRMYRQHWSAGWLRSNNVWSQNRIQSESFLVSVITRT